MFHIYVGEESVTSLLHHSIGLHRFLRRMNYQLYPWLENLKNPSTISFLQHAKQELCSKGVTTIPNFITKEALENIREESVEKSERSVEQREGEALRRERKVLRRKIFPFLKLQFFHFFFLCSC